MARIEMFMPKMGESVMEGTILSWLKKPGDTVVADESVLEIATDKVDTEIPAPQNGLLKEILAQKGDTVPVGQVIAILEVEEEQKKSPQEHPQQVPHSPPPTSTKQKAPLEASSSILTSRGKDRFYSPLVRSIAKKEHIQTKTLDTIPGTGKNHRLTKDDLLNYLSQRVPQQDPNPVALTPGDEVIEMDRMRSMIASRMLDSRRTAAHVTSFVEADVTKIVKWRARIKLDFYNKTSEALTLTPIFIQAVLRAIADFPMVNISVSGNKIIRRKCVNLGLAVALPSGNLIVPVIKHADQLSLKGLILAVNDLSRRARTQQLKPDELSEGTYTVSNVGTFGNIMGTPIIMQPQCAILALGMVKKRPVVLTDEQGEDVIAIRHMMYLSHSYDHRVIDGALGGSFANKVVEYLQAFDDSLSSVG